MCAPSPSPRFALPALQAASAAGPARLHLDDLGLRVRDRTATPAVREAFARELSRWTRQRVQRCGGRRLQPADVSDVSQEFVLRCLTRHFAGWDPQAVTLSAYLYRRLRHEVIDRQRQLRRRSVRDVDVDDLELPGQQPTLEDIQVVRERERRLRHLDDVVATLPRRQEMVVRRTLRGERLEEIARGAGVHHSTLSRDRTRALKHMQAVMVPLAA